MYGPLHYYQLERTWGRFIWLSFVEIRGPFAAAQWHNQNDLLLRAWSPSPSLGLSSRKMYILGIDGHRHQSQCRRYPTYDIDICYSDIGDKQCQTEKRHSVIGSVPILTSEFILISDIEEKKKFHSADSKPAPLGMISECCNTKLLCLSV